MAWKRFSVEKPSLNKTYSPKTRRKIRICRYQVKKHIFYVSSLALSMRQPLSFKVVKNKPQIEKDPVCRGIRKDPKMKKKTISVTVTYLLISKTASSESRSELSYGELTRVQADRVCQRYMKSLFDTRLLCGETGRFTRRTRNRRTLNKCFLSGDGYQTIIYNRDLNITEP